MQTEATAENQVIQKLNLRTFFDGLLHRDRSTPREKAEKIGKTPEVFRANMRRGRMQLSSFIDMLSAFDEKLTLRLKDGSIVEIELNDINEKKRQYDKQFRENNNT